MDTASGPWVTLAANTWTELTVSRIKPTSTEVYAGDGAGLQKAVGKEDMSWDDIEPDLLIVDVLDILMSTCRQSSPD